MKTSIKNSQYRGFYILLFGILNFMMGYSNDLVSDRFIDYQQTDKLTYLPIMESGKSWTYRFEYLGIYNESFYVTASVDKQVEIGNRSCWKVNLTSDNPKYESGYVYIYEAYGELSLYNDGHYPYLPDLGCVTGYNEFIPLLNLNRYNRQTDNIGINSEKSIDINPTININGIDRRFFLSNDENSAYAVECIEGIGVLSEHDYITNRGYTTGSIVKNFIACYQNGNMLLSYKDFDRLSPTPYSKADSQWSTDSSDTSLLVANGECYNSFVPFYFKSIINSPNISKIIYSGEMISELKDKFISKLSFHTTPFPYTINGRYRIKLSHIDNNVLSDQDIKLGYYPNHHLHEFDSMIVFEGNVTTTANQDIFSIPLDTPFLYVGGNLLLEIENMCNDSFPCSVGFYGIVTNNYNAINISSLTTDSYNFIPATRFEVTTEDPQSRISLYPLKLSFDNVILGESASATLYLTNNSQDPIDLDDLKFDNNLIEASLGNEVSRLAYGQTAKYTLRVTPVIEGEYSGRLNIISNNINTEISFNGKSIAAPKSYLAKFGESNDTQLPRQWKILKCLRKFNEIEFDDCTTDNKDLLNHFKADNEDGIGFRDYAGNYESEDNYFYMLISPKFKKGKVLMRIRSMARVDYDVLFPNVRMITLNNDSGLWDFADNEIINLTYHDKLSNNGWGWIEFETRDDSYISIYLANNAIASIYADGLSKINEIEINNETSIECNQATIIYDLHGHKVDSPQRGSIYIRNGKKIVWE